MDLSQDLSSQLRMMGIPPNRARLEVAAPLSNTQDVQASLTKLGLTSPTDIPQSWDWREKLHDVGLKLQDVQNQANCGNCWAMSSTAALTDRFIINKGRSDIKLNPLIITACQIGNSAGCNGGFPADAGRFFEQKGAAQDTTTCQSWEQFCTNANSCGINASSSPDLPDCNQLEGKCKFDFRAKKGTTKSLAVDNNPQQTVHNIKLDILQNGPVVGAYFVAKDFVTGTGMKGSNMKYRWNATNGIYINGAYNDDLSKLTGQQDDYSQIINEGGGPAGHAVEIVGWGVGNAGSKYGNVPYWIIKNSWSSDWNDDGYFKFATYPHNQNCGMDVPVKMGNGGLFGGATSFEVDPATGGPANPDPPKPSPKPSPSSTEKKPSKVWLWIFLAIFAILVIILIIFTLKSDKPFALPWSSTKSSSMSDL